MDQTWVLERLARSRADRKCKAGKEQSREDAQSFL
jgi:hypothetical protein